MADGPAHGGCCSIRPSNTGLAGMPGLPASQSQGSNNIIIRSQQRRPFSTHADTVQCDVQILAAGQQCTPCQQMKINCAVDSCVDRRRRVPPLAAACGVSVLTSSQIGFPKAYRDAGETYSQPRGSPASGCNLAPQRQLSGG
jgi:hypothetical protein